MLPCRGAGPSPPSFANCRRELGVQKAIAGHAGCVVAEAPLVLSRTWSQLRHKTAALILCAGSYHGFTLPKPVDLTEQKLGIDVPSIEHSQHVNAARLTCRECLTLSALASSAFSASTDINAQQQQHPQAGYDDLKSSLRYL